METLSTTAAETRKTGAKRDPQTGPTHFEPVICDG
jgi:hypothetical protein